MMGEPQPEARRADTEIRASVERATLSRLPRAPYLRRWAFISLLRPRRGRGGAIPVRRLLVGPGHAQRRRLVEGLGVDHQADRQALPREAARQVHRAEVQDIAERGIAQVAAVGVRVALGVASMAASGGAGSAWRGRERVDVGQRPHDARAQRRPLAQHGEVVGGRKVGARPSSDARPPGRARRSARRGTAVHRERLRRDHERPPLLGHRLRDLRDGHAVDVGAEPAEDAARLSHGLLDLGATPSKKTVSPNATRRPLTPRLQVAEHS